MESLFLLESTRSSIILIGILVGFFVFWIVLSGFWMKLANYLCGGTPVGITRATLAALLSMVLACVASVMAVCLQPEDPPYVSAIYGNFGAVLGIAVVLFQNPLRAFLTYVVCSVLQVLSAIGFVIAYLILVTFVVPAGQLEQLGSQLGDLARQRDLESRASIKSWMVSDDPVEETEVRNVKKSGVALARERKAKPANELKKLPLGDGVQPNPFAQ